MIFQQVLKGIPAQRGGRGFGLSDEGAQEILDKGGIYSNWWLNAPGGRITPPQIAEKLNEQALADHLVNYQAVQSETPFISTTAGTVERDPGRARNIFFPPMYTALRFATRDFTQDGYVFYAYVFLLGKKSIELEEFAEEVRDLNTYTGYYPWHPEGEILAKVHIPATRIRKAEKYECEALEKQLNRGQVPAPQQVLRGSNDVYRDPWQFANVRGFPEAP